MKCLTGFQIFFTAKHQGSEQNFELKFVARFFQFSNNC